MLRAILDADVLGIALLRGHPWVHLMVNAQSDRLTGSRSALGRSLDEASVDAWPNVTSALQRAQAAEASLHGGDARYRS